MLSTHRPGFRAKKWLTTGAMVLAAFAGGGLTTHLAEATPQSDSPYMPFDQMARVLLLVEHDYVEPAERQKILDGAIRGMVAELDPHSAYMNPEEYAAFQSDTEGQFAGIGIEVDVREGDVTVIAPIEGSPAQKAGLLSGDRILAVDGKLLDGLRIDKIVTFMRGEAGSIVHLTIGRDGAKEPLHFDVTRAVVHVSSVEGKRLDGNIGYLRLKQFQETTHEELLTEVGKLRKGGDVNGVILDMRYNPGGLVDQAELVSDEMLSGGMIYSTRHRGRILDEVDATPGGSLSNVPIVVLLNEYTASAAELVAGSLQDNGRAMVVGATSFGKGSVQTIFDLPGGAGLRLTTMRYYTPNGRAIQAEGITPDVWIKPAKQADVFRERDLAGHLAGENGADVRKNQIVVQAPKDPTPNEPLERVSEVASDPTKGTDFYIAEGYRRLKTKMGQ